jgi:membrane protein YdbS with pleckstrin-like domain
MKQLHPGAKWQFRIGIYVLLAFAGIFVSSFLGAFLIPIFGGSGFAIVVIFWILFIFGLGEIYAQLAYKNWKYKLSENNLKTEKGIVWKKYSSIPYERVQNIDIQRGILARILGFSSINIQTAGYSGYHGRGLHSEGYIPAVSIKEAEEIREFLVKKIDKNSGF